MPDHVEESPLRARTIDRTRHVVRIVAQIDHGYVHGDSVTRAV
jgi:hypothetical protein